MRVEPFHFERVIEHVAADDLVVGIVVRQRRRRPVSSRPAAPSRVRRRGAALAAQPEAERLSGPLLCQEVFEIAGVITWADSTVGRLG